MAAPALTRRALNRATLRRQLLLERAPMPAYDAVHDLAGLQAQVPAVPYVALWSRLADFDPGELSGLTAERSVVRSPLMRTTIHLVTADDALAWRPLLQQVLTRTYRSTAWGQALRAELDLDAVAAAGHALVVERPRTRADLGAALVEQFPGHDPTALAMATTYLVPLVQTTPRGLWGRNGAPTWAATEQWLGRAGSAGELEALVLRYLAAFGPATVQDVQAWCGLTRLREVTDGLGDRLRELRSDEGTLLLDLPDAPLPDPEVPAPVRFLPEYDNALLSYADRRRFVGDAGFTTVERATRRGQIGTLLVDGLVRAMWTMTRDDDGAVLEVLPAEGLPRAARGEIEAEAGRLLGLLAPGITHEVRLP